MIPEFPGQTHVWIWREIIHLRRWGVSIQIFSTRRPTSRDRARHAFAAAEEETCYLWPIGMFQALGGLLWAAMAHPIGLVRCLGLGFSLPVTKRPRWRYVLPLIVPSCVMARISKKLNISRLHSHSCANSAILCMMVKRLLGTEFSLTLNADIEWWGGAMKEKFEDADFTNCHAQWLLNQMKRDFPILSPNQCLLARVGVDTRKWMPGDERESSQDGAVRLISVGRLHQSKGHDILLKAVESLVRGGAGVTLRIIGDGPERQALEAQASKAGLSDRVTFLGSLSEEQIIEQMRCADIFVLASHAEALGVVFMEAMSMRVATVGTAVGGVGEIITDGVDGVLVPPADPEALAGAIRHLVGDEDRRKRIAAAGRLTAVERFDSRLGAATLYERITGHFLEVEVAVSSSKPAATTSGIHTTSNQMSTHF